MKKGKEGELKKSDEMWLKALAISHRFSCLLITLARLLDSHRRVAEQYPCVADVCVVGGLFRSPDRISEPDRLCGEEGLIEPSGNLNLTARLG